MIYYYNPGNFPSGDFGGSGRKYTAKIIQGRSLCYTYMIIGRPGQMRPGRPCQGRPGRPGYGRPQRPGQGRPDRPDDFGGGSGRKCITR